MDSNQNKIRAKRYSTWKTRLFLFDIVVSLIGILVFQVFFAQVLSEVALNISANFYLALSIFISVFLVFLYVITLPLHYISTFVMEHRYSLSRQTFWAWAVDEIKSNMISFVILFFSVQVLYVFLRNFSEYWWLLSAVCWIFFSVILARFMPVVLLPLFYKYSPILDGSLKKSIIDLSQKAGIKLIDVCQIDFSNKTTKSNAALIGLGKSRKVILADNLIREFSQEEIEAVVAHEFGHFKYKHMWRLLLFSAVSTLISFFILSIGLNYVAVNTVSIGLSDMKLFPVLVLLIGIMNVFLLPVQNYYSRCLERQADRFSLDLTGSSEHFVSTMNKLAEKNLADTDPSKIKKIFFYNHPPICERIEMARKRK